MTEALEQQLLNHAALIARLRHDLDRLAHETTDAIADLLTRVEPQVAATTPRISAAWCWRDLGENGRDELWIQLIDWVGYLRSRYPLPASSRAAGLSTPSSSRNSVPCGLPGKARTKIATHRSRLQQTGTTDGSPACCTASSTAPSPPAATPGIRHDHPRPTRCKPPRTSQL